MNSTATVPFDYTVLFGYKPNEYAAYTMAVLFGLLFLIVLVLSLRFMSWYFLAVSIAGAMECVGFYYRTNYQSVWKYILTTLLILIAPTIYAMADYTLLSKLMIKANIRLKILTPKRVRYVFLLVDISCFCMQTAGGIMSGNDDINTAKAGRNVLLAGLSIALTIFALCLIVLVSVHVHIIINRKSLNLSKEKVIIYVLYINMLLLILRSSYRVVEYTYGITANESLFYGLEAVPMLILNALWVPFHPGFWNMARDSKESEDEDKEAIIKV